MLTLATGGTIAGKAGTAAAVTCTIMGDAVGVSDSFTTLYQGQLPNTATTLYTVPGSTQALVKQIHLANTMGTDVTGIVFYTGGTAAGNQITGTMTIVANGTAVYANGLWESYDSAGILIYTYALADNAITNLKLADMATDTVKGRALSAGTGDPTDLSRTQLTALCNLVTTTVAGNMSATDKTKLDNIWIDVTANPTATVLPGNTAAANITAINAILSAAPNGSTIYFPPGIYQFNAAWTMPNKMFTFCGRGSNRAGSPATAFTELRWTASVGGDLITLPGSGNGWYTQFRDLVFTANTADQASGAVINANGNVGINILNCSFQSSGTFFFDVLKYDGGSGSNSANSTVVENCNIQGYKGTGIRVNASGSSLVVTNTIIQGQWGGTGSTPASAMAAAGISGGFVGALQINDCDILGNVNNLLLNPVLANSEVAASVFCTNTYMDNSGGSCVKVTGTGATVRARFDTCSFTTAGTNFTTVGTNLTAVELASTFAYAAGGQGIDFVNCNVLNTFGTTGTTNGFLVSGTADFSISNSRIAAWTNGIQVTPIGTASRTQAQISNNTVGVAGGYGGNSVGILLNVGSAAYGSMIIESNHLVGNTTPMTDNSAVGASDFKSINSNTGRPTGQVSQNGFNAALTTNASLAYLTLPVPANSGYAGLRIRGKIYCHTANVLSILNPKILWGTTGTISDTLIVCNSNAQTVTTGVATTGGISIDLDITFRSATIVIGNMTAIAGGSAVAAGQTVSVSTVQTLTNTSSLNFFTLVLTQSGTASTVTVDQAFLEVVGG